MDSEYEENIKDDDSPKTVEKGNRTIGRETLLEVEKKGRCEREKKGLAVVTRDFSVVYFQVESIGEGKKLKRGAWASSERPVG